MLEPHEDAVLFREAVQFTQVRTGLAARLIEKDYFCTVLLGYLATADPTLVFKGGTCLAKVHADFYRMSEDLDYAIPVATEGSRSERSRLVPRFREAMHALPQQVPGFQIVQPVRGANNSTQYHVVVGYQSRLTARQETIQVEVALREPLSTLDGNRIRADAIVNRIIARPEGKVSFGRWDVWQHDPAKWDAARDELGAMIER